MAQDLQDFVKNQPTVTHAEKDDELYRIFIKAPQGDIVDHIRFKSELFLV